MCCVSVGVAYWQVLEVLANGRDGVCVILTRVCFTSPVFEQVLRMKNLHKFFCTCST